MNLKESISAAALKRGSVCTVEKLLRSLSEADAALLVECLNDPQYSHAQIYRGLKTEGHVLSQNIVQRHRKGDCDCEHRPTAEPTDV